MAAVLDRVDKAFAASIIYTIGGLSFPSRPKRA